jgi:hypothetical protein
MRVQKSVSSCNFSLKIVGLDQTAACRTAFCLFDDGANGASAKHVDIPQSPEVKSWPDFNVRYRWLPIHRTNEDRIDKFGKESAIINTNVEYLRNIRKAPLSGWDVYIPARLDEVA